MGEIPDIPFHSVMLVNWYTHCLCNNNLLYYVWQFQCSLHWECGFTPPVQKSVYNFMMYLGLISLPQTWRHCGCKQRKVQEWATRGNRWFTPTRSPLYSGRSLLPARRWSGRQGLSRPSIGTRSLERYSFTCRITVESAQYDGDLNTTSATVECILVSCHSKGLKSVPTWGCYRQNSMFCTSHCAVGMVIMLSDSAIVLGWLYLFALKLFCCCFSLQGAFVYEGRMIDRPLLLQAENIINLQQSIDTHVY